MDMLKFVSQSWPIIIFLIGILITLGRMIQKMSAYVTHEQVKDIVAEEVNNHSVKCPLAKPLEKLDEPHLEKFIDKRIELHPMLKKYNITQYRIEQLEPDVKDIKNDINLIKLALAKLQEK